MLDIYKSKSFIRNVVQVNFFKSTISPRKWDRNQVFRMSGFHFMKKKMRFFQKIAVFQNFNIIAARVTIIQLRWSFVLIVANLF